MWQDEYLDDIWRHGSSDRDMCTDYTWLRKKQNAAKAKQPRNNPFKVGDLVRLRNGAACMRVLAVQDHLVKADYTSRLTTRYGGSVKWRPVADFVHYKTQETNSQPSDEGTDDMKNKLYQTREETPRFGTMLATNSQGKLVLEMKGTGEVIAFDKNEVEVVMPYTFGIRFPGNSTEYHYLGAEGDVEVGDYVILDNSPVGKSEIARVTSVNTRSDHATVTFRGVKLLTKRIGD